MIPIDVWMDAMLCGADRVGPIYLSTSRVSLLIIAAATTISLSAFALALA